MANLAQIDSQYKTLHAELEARYYSAGELSKEDFDAQHQQLWRDYEADLIANGLGSLREDLKDSWGKALTTDAKLAIVARAFGWE